ncbi:MAG TPA: hypothetical protein ENI76_10860 [Ignavibacteria bacterium]|nr:hypothetical protein [Ignavibacteria bacterium]
MTQNNTGSFWGDIKWFKPEEFMCKHHMPGVCEFKGRDMMSHEFVRRLDFIRGEYGQPLKVTSGFRCEKFDKYIGGKGNHPTGEAADLLVLKGEHMYAFIDACQKAKILRIAVYKSKPHTHIDIVVDKPKGLFVL